MSQITTHILDTSVGLPAGNVPVSLQTSSNGQWQNIGTGVTNPDGRVEGLVVSDMPLYAGVYKLRFDTATYYKEQRISSFYPFIEIVFEISGDGQHYHVPLLLNPYGYSTYRGS